jgi:hypothetical protein
VKSQPRKEKSVLNQSKATAAQTFSLQDLHSKNVLQNQSKIKNPTKPLPFAKAT